MDRPLGDPGHVGELDQLAARLLFDKDLGAIGAVRDEHQPAHRVVVGGNEKERLVMDRRGGRHLPHGRPGAFVDERPGFGREACSPHRVIASRRTAHASPSRLPK
jgi:hypothetical protein